MHRNWFVSGIAAGLGVVATAGSAAAAGFMIRENSAEGVGTAFAGNASRADDVSTVFNNPAGMTDLSGTQFELGIAAPFVTANFHGTDSEPDRLGPVLGNTGNDSGRTGLIPDFYAVTDITDRIKGGIAITAPFGNTIKYNSDFVGRYLGTIVGVILIVLLNSVLSIMQMPEAGRQIIYGGVIIAMLLVYGRGEALGG